MNDKCNQIPIEAIKTVAYRLKTISPELMFSSGVDSQSYSRDEMIKQVEMCSEVGVDFVNTEIDFLKAQASGQLIRLINS